jgi:hypothetical protein
LNLVGIVTRDIRVPAVRGNRIAFRNGRPIASREAHAIRFLSDVDEAARQRAERLLTAPGALGKAGTADRATCNAAVLTLPAGSAISKSNLEPATLTSAGDESLIGW